MLIFDVLLIVGLLVNQGHLLENELMKKVTVMFFAVTTVFGQGMIILLCSFLLLEVTDAASITIACICIIIGAIDMAIGYNQDPTVKFLAAENELPQVDDPADKMKQIYFDNPAPAQEVITFARRQLTQNVNQAQAEPQAVNTADIELQGVAGSGTAPEANKMDDEKPQIQKLDSNSYIDPYAN